MHLSPRVCLQAVGNEREPVRDDCESEGMPIRHDCEPKQARVCKPLSYFSQAATRSGCGSVSSRASAPWRLPTPRLLWEYQLAPRVVLQG